MVLKQEHICVSTTAYVPNNSLSFSLLSGWLKATNTYWNLIEQKLIFLLGYARFLCFINFNNVITKTAL